MLTVVPAVPAAPDDLRIAGEPVRSVAERAEPVRPPAGCAARCHDEMRVTYQSVVELHTEVDRRPRRQLEALLRWKHPTRGLLDPATFPGLAEQPELTAGIAAAVLTQACTVAAEWQDPDHESSVAVNVSGAELSSPGFTDRVHGALRATRTDPSWLWMTVTEQTLGCAGARAAAAMTDLADLGIRWSLDAAGMVPSLGLAQRYPVRAVKLGGGMVAGLGGRAGAAQVGGVVFLARLLGLEIFAEGVETLAQLHHLDLLGCDHAQGPLLGGPSDRALPAVVVSAARSPGTGRARPAGSRRNAVSRSDLAARRT